MNADTGGIAPAPTTFDATGEVRFAVVLYGGVSLAIYMNGIVQELFALVRATAPEIGVDGRLHVTKLTPVEEVYRELACQLDGTALLPAPGNAVKTRFVVDILTGTSAGGINGVFLAKALANDQLIDQLTDLWINEGDISKLLNDKTAYADLGDLPHEKPPESLLSGQFMLFKLLAALDGMSNPPAGKTRADTEAKISPYADQIDLWVTSTDLNGRPEPVALSDQARLGKEREVDHHTRFHFIYDATGFDTPISMFQNGYDPLLAFAARATSSFPAAFRPVQPIDLESVQKAYAGIRPDPKRDWHALDSAQTRQLFQRYGEPPYYESVSFADGGYLDNQPVDLVMETLPKRSADLPVRRRVLLVDPDPGAEAPEHAQEDAARVDILSTLLKVVTLPREETIGTEVDRIEALAGPIATRTSIYAAVEASIAAGNTDATTSPTYAGYLALRVGNTIADITDAIARIGFLDRAYDVDSQEFRLARAVVQQWYAQNAHADFLETLDLAFVLRRINFLKHGLGGGTSAIKELDYIRQQLIRDGRQLRSREPTTPAVDALRTALDTFRKLSSDSDAPLAARQAACATAAGALPPVLKAFADALALADETRYAEVVVRGLNDTTVARRWDHFDSYDDATLALRQLIPGENDDIGVVRVSPADAQTVFCQQPGRPKLAGVAVHHFGGFFDADWRRTDIMWGRLDACERLITVVLDEETQTARRDELIQKGQRAIIAELLDDTEYARLFTIIAPGCDKPQPGDSGVEADGSSRTYPNPESILAALQNYVASPGPSREKVLELATRASRVTDALVGGLPEPAGPMAQVRKWVSVVLRPASQFGELILDRSVKSAITRHLLDIVILAAILMIIVGPFLGGAGVAGFGWTVFAIAIGIKLIVNLGRDWVHHEGNIPLVLVIVGAILTLAALEGLQLASGFVRWTGLFALGAAAGFLFAACKPGAKGPRPIISICLAGVILVGCTAIGIAEVASHPVAKLCHQSKWEHDVIDKWVPGTDCPTP